jgi:hypothetical protein
MVWYIGFIDIALIFVFVLQNQLLLLEDSDYYSLYDDKERSEFLFRIFTHVCIGGPICQAKHWARFFLVGNGE